MGNIVRNTVEVGCYALERIQTINLMDRAFLLGKVRIEIVYFGEKA